MTYSNDEYVQELADDHGLNTKAVAMKTTHHAEMTELLISKDLSWLQEVEGS
jgi:DNA adenine methylase